MEPKTRQELLKEARAACDKARAATRAYGTACDDAGGLRAPGAGG